jgi:hypothetical protein
VGKLGAVTEGTACRNDGIPEAQSANLNTQVNAIGGCHTEDEDTMKLCRARPESGCGLSISRAFLERFGQHASIAYGKGNPG